MRRRSQHVEIKSSAQIAVMRRAGLVVARALREMAAAAEPGVSTADLDELARSVLREEGARSSFLGYDVGTGPYPAVICASVNERVVHGIPSRTEKLRDGDVISIDFGAVVDGWHGDAAASVLIGEVSPRARALSEACEHALWAGIAAARDGARLGDISHAVESTVRAAGPYGIVAGYGGHGIGSRMHMEPHILNYGRPGRGLRLRSGMALAIEPMITLGGSETVEHTDGWTVSTADGSWAAHWEHTVALMDDGAWVLTAEDGGAARLAELGARVSAHARG